MPKLFFILLLSSFYSLLATPTIHASTDPQNATVSATATIESAGASPNTQDSLAPPPVILVSPHDGATTNQSRPEFVWIQTFDQNSNFSYDDVYLNGIATYLGISNTGNSQHSNYISHLGDGRVYLTPTLDLPEGKYDWHVVALDASNNQSISTHWHLTIDKTPPHLALTDINNLYHYPQISEDTSFDLPTEEAVLTFLTEPYATVTLQQTLPDQTTLSYASPTNSTGVALIKARLPIGTSKFLASSFDSAGYTSALPRFILTYQASAFGFNQVITSLPKLSMLSQTPSFIPSLPATNFQISVYSQYSLYLWILLSILGMILLIIIWNRHNNLVIYHNNPNHVYRSILVYHYPFSNTQTSRQPSIYSLKRGTAYVPALTQFSTLVINTKDHGTYSLCLLHKRNHYRVTLSD
ncbi:MAG: hypothetical protein E6R05_05385 [Candidatus Moraniibacteriota bacterium]|nr:MAG: hypothetical protein E6R05_05385 [Candidatus Moranbacteria bacterium]